MNTDLISDFPRFDTGLFDDAEFLMFDSDARLIVLVRGIEPIVIDFHNVRWHEYTAMYNCSPEQIKAYFKLVEIVDSPVLQKYIENDTAWIKAYDELRHYRVYVDEHGCHEVFAESVTAT